MFVNPFQQTGTWYKANLHTHTTASDGACTAQERVRHYRDRGYSVLAITDHGLPCDVTALTSPELLVIGGIEVTAQPRAAGPCYHLVCLNISADATVPSTLEPDDVIAWAKQEGGETVVAHPYWSGNDVPDLLRVHGHVGIEVFNATCQSIGKGYSSVHWDYLLAAGVKLPALAVDDAHGSEDGADLSKGWALLRLKSLSVEAVLEALRTGCYYSSSGAEIHDFRIEAGRACVRCSPGREIHLMAAGWHGRSIYAGGRALLTEASAELDADWKYVRAEVVDAQGGRAWTNPIWP